IDVLQPGAEARRIPIAGAAHLTLEIAGYGRDDGADVVSHPMGLVVIVERDALWRRGGRERNVRAVLLGVQSVVHVPGAIERYLVFVRSGGCDAESVAPDVAIGVVHELRGRASRIPVTGATRFRLVVAGNSHRCGSLRACRFRGEVRCCECEQWNEGANAPAA